MLLPSIHLFLSSLPPLSLSLSLSLSLRVLQDTTALLLYITALFSHSPLFHSASLLFSLLLSTHSDRMLPVISGHCWVCVAAEVDPDTLKVFSPDPVDLWGREGGQGGVQVKSSVSEGNRLRGFAAGAEEVMLHELIGFRTETPHASPPQCGALFRMAGTSGRERRTSWMLLGHSTGPYGNCAMQPSFRLCACLRYPWDGQIQGEERDSEVFWKEKYLGNIRLACTDWISC